MKKIVISIVVIFLVSLVGSQTANAQSSFLIGPKAEKKWMEYFYRANGAAPAPQPSTMMSNGVGFVFTTTPDVSGFSTKHPAYNGTLLGNLTGGMVTADYVITAPANLFVYYGYPASCATPPSVRLYFETNNNELGYSQYWWSSPESEVLANGPFSLTVALDPALWSNWNGQFGTSDPEGFAEAVADVQQIGLSFGGGCHYANGVGETSGNATFELTNFVVQQP